MPTGNATDASNITVTVTMQDFESGRHFSQHSNQQARSVKISGLTRTGIIFKHFRGLATVRFTDEWQPSTRKQTAFSDAAETAMTGFSNSKCTRDQPTGMQSVDHTQIYSAHYDNRVKRTRQTNSTTEDCASRQRTLDSHTTCSTDQSFHHLTMPKLLPDKTLAAF